MPVVSISAEHNALHRARAYSVTQILPNLAVGAVSYIELITPSTCIVATQGYNIMTDGLIKSEFFEAPTVTNGTTQIPIVQRKRSELVPANTIIYSNPTAVSGGTLLRTLVFGEVEGLGVTMRPLYPTGADAMGFNLKPLTKYVVKLTNIGSITTTVLFLNWDIYEV